MIQEHISLKPYTTFRLGGTARYFAVCTTLEDIQECINFAHEKNVPIFPLGGGSNIIVFDTLSDFLCIKIQNKGIQVLEEDTDTVLIRVAAGEVWDDFVTYAVEHCFSGIEALSMIPGTCGAAPVQNIGAYGSEVSDTIEYVYGYDIKSGNTIILSKKECRFGYRDSIFKRELKGKYIIESVDFRLSKKEPKIPAYPKVSEVLDMIKRENSDKNLLWCIRSTIQKIRSEKLPNPQDIPSAGSFFKNVFVDKEVFSLLMSRFPTIPSFEKGGTHKIPAGWLIEQAKYKGYSKNGVGVYSKNALVLINESAQSTAPLLDLAHEIQSAVFEKFGVQLEFEPEVVV